VRQSAEVVLAVAALLVQDKEILVSHQMTEDALKSLVRPIVCRLLATKSAESQHAPVAVRVPKVGAGKVLVEQGAILKMS